MSDYECERLQSEICDDEVKKAEVDQDSLQVSEKCEDENGNLSGPEGEMSKSEISDKYVDKIKIEQEALEVPTKTEEEENYILVMKLMSVNHALITVIRTPKIQKWKINHGD